METVVRCVDLCRAVYRGIRGSLWASRPAASDYAGPTHHVWMLEVLDKTLLFGVDARYMSKDMGVPAIQPGLGVGRSPIETQTCKKAMLARNRAREKRGKCTYRYIQLLVSRLGLPVSHSGANVIQPPYISAVARTIIQKYFFSTPFFSSLERR